MLALVPGAGVSDAFQQPCCAFCSAVDRMCPTKLALPSRQHMPSRGKLGPAIVSKARRVEQELLTNTCASADDRLASSPKVERVALQILNRC